MKVPLKWLADYVDISTTPEELARLMTFAGLEVEAMTYVGLPLPPEGSRAEAKIQGLEWGREHIVVASILEVMEHPDADRLVLARLDDGLDVHTIVTGAPNLRPMMGAGPLDDPLKVICAREGSTIYDGHKSGQQPTRLKRTKIRGVESYMMACSEKELGISDEHEGVILLDADAPEPGTPLVDYIGDVVLDVAITPNVARAACLIGVAREVAALTGQSLKTPDFDIDTGAARGGPPVVLDIREPRLNPRFTASLLEGVRVGPSPYWLQLRLRLAGMRPINNVVDVSNYVMLEVGQPLHAFDYDVLLERAARVGSDTVTIVTRLAEPDERLTTLDGEDRALDESTIMVADAAGALSIGGVMGGGESEVSESTSRVLIEAAAWEMINIRRTVQAQKLQTSEAGYRFSRGVHPALAILGNKRALDWMRRLSPGSTARGLVDEYPAPPEAQVVAFPLSEVERLLGIEIERDEIVRILSALEFTVEQAEGATLRVTVPDHRLDIETGVADLVEEVARIYGYERIPETQISDQMPPQRGNRDLDVEERIRDELVYLGLQEVITYRMTTPELEARVWSGEAPGAGYVELANPISSDRTVMRRSLLPSVLEIADSNLRFRDHVALFEIGKVFLPRAGEDLPDEPRQLVIVTTGPRAPEDWTGVESSAPLDYFDLKGTVEELLNALHLGPRTYEPTAHPTFHPGHAAMIRLGEVTLGTLGELHPIVRDRYDLGSRPVLAAVLDYEVLADTVDTRFTVDPFSRYPAIVEDIALIVDEAVTAATVEGEIRAAGGDRLVDVRLFDLYRGEQVGAGNKSLAYRLTYQSNSDTLTDEDAKRIRTRITKRVESALGATLRA